MKQFRCGDVVAGCAARFAAGSAEEIEALVLLHAEMGHGLSAAQLPLGFTTKVREAIHPMTD